jgi:ankyrin repeat protein
MDRIIETIWNSDLEGLRQELQTGKSPNYYYEHLTPLLWAISFKQPDMVDLLLDSGADPSALDTRHLQTAIHVAVAAELPISVLHRLLSGADVNKGDNTGMTPLMIAAKLGNHNLAAYLLENGADPTIYDDYLNGPLHWSAVGGSFPDLNAYLIAKGADPDARTAYGKTYFDIQREMEKAKG